MSSINHESLKSRQANSSDLEMEFLNTSTDCTIMCCLLWQDLPFGEADHEKLCVKQITIRLLPN